MAARDRTGEASRRDAGADSVVIVGGGITGLSAAHALSNPGEPGRRAPRVVLLEGASRLGGQIRTEREADHLLECGPDSLVTHKPAGARLCRQVGLGDQLIYPQARNAGLQLVHRGRLLDLPDGFMMMAPTRLVPLLRSPLFSWAGKLRMACEPWVPRSKHAEQDETLASFVTRRFGREALERAAEPILAGLYTADADRLSLQMTMPRFVELERRHGSVTRGLRHALREIPDATAAAAFVSLRDGMHSLVESLTARLPRGCVHTSARVDRLTRDHQADLWRVRVEGGQEFAARAVVLACPAFVSARLLQAVDAELANELSVTEYASCATVNLVYRKADLRRPLNRFGFFVPRTERSPLLACSHVSAKFAGRVADDRVLLRVFLGGALHPALLERTDDELVQLSDQTLRGLLGIEGRPLFGTTHRFPRSMPQFGLGQRDRVRRTAERVARHPGLTLGGGASGAIGLPDCIRSGEDAASVVLSALSRAPHQLELAI